MWDEQSPLALPDGPAIPCCLSTMTTNKNPLIYIFCGQFQHSKLAAAIPLHSRGYSNSKHDQLALEGS